MVIWKIRTKPSGVTCWGRWCRGGCTCPCRVHRPRTSRRRPWASTGRKRRWSRRAGASNSRRRGRSGPTRAWASARGWRPTGPSPLGSGRPCTALPTGPPREDAAGRCRPTSATCPPPISPSPPQSTYAHAHTHTIHLVVNNETQKQSVSNRIRAVVDGVITEKWGRTFGRTRRGRRARCRRRPVPCATGGTGCAGTWTASAGRWRTRSQTCTVWAGPACCLETPPARQQPGGLNDRLDISVPHRHNRRANRQ